MDETFRWLTTADLSRFEDSYVAIVNKEVICADEDPEIAYEEARRKHPGEKVVLWRVPRGDAFIFPVITKQEHDFHVAWMTDGKPLWAFRGRAA